MKPTDVLSSFFRQFDMMKRQLNDTYKDVATVPSNLLNETPLVYRLGAYIPPRRKGYSVTRGENKIQRRATEALFKSRIDISRDLRDHLSNGEQITVAAHQALALNGLSPRSVDGWIDHVGHVSDERRGEDAFFTELDRDVSLIDYLYASHKSFTAQMLLVCAVVMILALLGVATIPSTIGDTIVSSIGLVCVSACFALVMWSKSATASLVSIVAGRNRIVERKFEGRHHVG